MLVVITGAAGVMVFVASASAGMRDVMITDGGTCASGGPYIVAHQCSAADMRLLLSGILGGLLAAAIFAAGSAALGSAAAAGLISWTALFGLLGWNFIDLGRHPKTPGSDSSWLFCGGLFWLMAAGGLIVLLARVIGDLRAAVRPSPAVASMQPLVRAAVSPGLRQSGMWGYAPSVPEPERPAAVLRRTGLWLACTLAGAGLGIALSSTVVSLPK